MLFLYCFISILFLSCQQTNNHSEKELFLWYDQPAEKGQLNISAHLERPGDAENISVGKNQLIMTGNAFYDGKGTKFASVAAFQALSGTITSGDTSVTVKNAVNTGYNELKTRHIADYHINIQMNYWPAVDMRLISNGKTVNWSNSGFNRYLENPAKSCTKIQLLHTKLRPAMRLCLMKDYRFDCP